MSTIATHETLANAGLSSLKHIGTVMGENKVAYQFLD